MTKATQERAREDFDYEASTGRLVYKKAVRFHPEGTYAGTVKHGKNSGYRLIKWAGRTWQISWVIWLWHNGVLPKNELDHINMVRNDDRIENLRAATRSQNCMNRNRPLSKYGYRGVKRRSNGKFTATLVKDQKTHYFGQYDTVEAAARGYDEGAKIHFGEFAIFNFSDKIKRDWLYV